MDKFKIYWKNFIFLRTELKYLFFISLISVTVIELILSHFDEKFRNGYEIGQMILKLSYSYLSALLFYYLVVHFKRQNEKRKIYKILNDDIRFIFADEDTLYKELKKISLTDFKKNDESEIKDALSKIDLNSPFLAVSYYYGGRQKVSWKVHVEILADRTSENITQILAYTPLLDAECIILLKNVLNNRLYLTARTFKKLPVSSDYTGFSEPYLYYFNAVAELKSYKQKEIDKYLL